MRTEANIGICFVLLQTAGADAPPSNPASPMRQQESLTLSRVRSAHQKGVTVSRLTASSLRVSSSARAAQGAAQGEAAGPGQVKATIRGCSTTYARL